MNFEYNSLLKSCINRDSWKNISFFKSLFADVEISNDNLNDIQNILSVNLTTPNDKARFLKFIDGKLESLKIFSGIASSIGLFIGASYIGLLGDESIPFIAKVIMAFVTLGFVILTTYGLLNRSNNQAIQLKLIAELVQ